VHKTSIVVFQKKVSIRVFLDEFIVACHRIDTIKGDAIQSKQITEGWAVFVDDAIHIGSKDLHNLVFIALHILL
jgi:hypothetical protein